MKLLTSNIIPISRIRELKNTELNDLPNDYTAGKWSRFRLTQFGFKDLIPDYSAVLLLMK